MNVIECDYVATEAKVAIVIARFNDFINQSLLGGAINTLKRVGHVADENITVIWVPGTYELPFVVQNFIKKAHVDAVIALSSTIRGSTTHSDLLGREACSSLNRIALATNIPVAFGVTPTENIEQAIERAGTKMNNRGAEVAMTALEMINITKSINN
ncbi:6,7-dimethyl-8-ribityllumazine synthase [Serratia marcescens]|uniref:6,7-dimethyl-8-ribityllumazine synthase n=1 Tax=Serratia marcescens TaxID=615 RepID=UPI00148078FD|nr:6,7-dimethyl-8-ribityllumazine synthase [Serratia marcescens]NMM75079.1 6,7-dimethyl-8-ribityllumazine synthase [Serratia marcescens]